MNNLYIIEEVLLDYTPGMAVITAPNLERCREIFSKKFDGPGEMEEYDYAIENNLFKVIEGVNYNEGVVSYVYGGG